MSWRDELWMEWGGLVKVVAVIAIVAGVVCVVRGRRSEEPRLATVLIDNRTGQSVAVSVDGKDVGTVASNTHLAVQIEPGTHRVVARSGPSVADDAEIQIPDPTNWTTTDYEAIYNVGGRAEYVLVTLNYGSQLGPNPLPPVSTRLLADDFRGNVPTFFRIPAGVSGTLDETFPDSVNVPGSMRAASLTLLCHTREGSPTGGCSMP